MTPILKLQKGIQIGDWNLICEAYRDLTNEELETPDVPNPKILTTNYVISGQELLNLLDKRHREQEILDEQVIKILKPNKKSKKKQKIVRPKQQKQEDEVQFISDVDDDENYRKISKKVAATTKKRKREYREAYNEKTINCKECGNEFLIGQISKLSIGKGKESFVCDGCSKKR